MTQIKIFNGKNLNMLHFFAIVLNIYNLLARINHGALEEHLVVNHSAIQPLIFRINTFASPLLYRRKLIHLCLNLLQVLQELSLHVSGVELLTDTEDLL